MRVHELARALGLPSRVVLRQLRADGEWVQSHLSTVAEPVAGRYLQAEPAPREEHSAHPVAPERSPAEPGATTPATAAAVSQRMFFRRPPGPRPITRQRPAFDDYDDPLELLRYEPEITTRDIAQLLRVEPATVRRWVSRGHLYPSGKCGPSHLFNTSDVLAAREAIESRRRATNQPRREHRFGVELRRIDRIRPKHHDAVVSIDEAARLIDVSSSTIRSWLHRGHLAPHPSSKPRSVRLRIGDVLATARARKLPSRSLRSRAHTQANPRTKRTTR